MRFTVRTVTRPIATTMVFLALALLGLVAYSRLGVDLLPDIAIPRRIFSFNNSQLLCWDAVV